MMPHLLFILMVCIETIEKRSIFVAGEMIHVDLSIFGIVNKPIDYNPYSYDLDTWSIYNLKGINTELNDTLFLLDESRKLYLIFENSHFDLYDNSEALVDAERCDVDYFEKRDIHYFSNMNKVVFGLSLNTNHFRRPICPYLFKNANIGQLVLMAYGNNYLYRNFISFYEIRNANNSTVNLNARVNLLMFKNLYRHQFIRHSLKFFSSISVYYFGFSGIVASIDKDFFRDFYQMINLFISVHDAGDFFRSSTNEWLATVFIQMESFQRKEDYLVYITQSARFRVFLIRVLQESLANYAFPDEDFCLFKYFPRFKPIISDLQTKKTEFSCTHMFLSQNNEKILTRMRAQGVIYPTIVTFNDSLLDECHFDQLLSMCFNASFSSNYSHLRRPVVGYLDVIYALGWFEYLGPIITFPIFTAAALAFNLLIILIINHKKNKREKLHISKTFRLIEMNAAFNCCECLVYQFRLMGICLGLNSVYCSSVRDSPFALYLGSANIYLSEVMKSCSMMTGLLFSLQRYIETSKTEIQLLKAFSHTKVRHMLLVVLFYGSVISVPCTYNITLSPMIEYYDLPNTFYLRIESYMYKSQAVASYFYFAHFIVNDVVILLLNLAVDILLVKVIKEDLIKKAENAQKMIDLHHSGLSKIERLKLAEDEKKKSTVERKANSMIVVSIVIYSFCRLPEVVGVFVLYYFYYFSKVSCTSLILCYLIANSIEYMYMLSYLSNIFIYYKYNIFFRKGFRNFFKFNRPKYMH